MTTEVERSLAPLFEQADREGLWFFHGGLSGPLWFSPAELRQQHEQRRFLWGAENWTLRSPDEYLEEYRRRLQTAENQYERARAWVARAREKP